MARGATTVSAPTKNTQAKPAERTANVLITTASVVFAVTDHVPVGAPHVTALTRGKRRVFVAPLRLEPTHRMLAKMAVPPAVEIRDNAMVQGLARITQMVPSARQVPVSMVIGTGTRSVPVVAALLRQHKIAVSTRVRVQDA